MEGWGGERRESQDEPAGLTLAGWAPPPPTSSLQLSAITSQFLLKRKGGQLPLTIPKPVCTQ